MKPLTYISKAIAYLTHPLLMPTICVYLLFCLISEFTFKLPNSFLYLIYLVVFLCTFLFPAIATFTFYKLGFIAQLEMTDRKSRYLPYLAAAISFSICFYFINQVRIIPPVIKISLLSAILSVIATSIVNTFYKISAHMVASGGMVGSIVSIGLLYSIDVYYILLSSILIAGITGASRLILNAHKSSEIYTGFALGLFCQLILLLGVF